MSISMSAVVAHEDDRRVVRKDRDAEHNFLPDFAWAAAGGGVALVVSTLVLMLSASLGGGSPLSTFGRELAAAFLAGFLVVLVARSLTARSH
jgi:hypothetical protein